MRLSFSLNQSKTTLGQYVRYTAKSDPYIVLISTPNAPNGLMDKIDREPDDACIYKRFRFDYTVGLDRIYTKEEIDNH
jgi:hypothetical protein